MYALADIAFTSNREREREEDRQTDRQTDRQRERERERERGERFTYHIVEL